MQSAAKHIAELKRTGRVRAALSAVETAKKDGSEELLLEELKQLGCDVDALQQDDADTREVLASLLEEEGWRECRNDELRVSYKKEEDDPVHRFKFEATFETATLDLLSLAREFDLISSWNTFILDPTILCRTSFTGLMVYLGVWVPWPATSKDVILSARGFDLIDEQGDVVCIFQSEDPPQGAQSVPESAEGRSRVALHKSGFKMKPISATHTQTSIIFNVDPCMNTPPNWLISFVLSVMSPWIYGKVVNVLKEIMQKDGAYRQRQDTDEHRPFYRHFAERIASYSRDLDKLDET
ncbi:hypothetical protein CYMTET_11720 [Cymbomonas tetramitiformis]|uniref:START domain-containing protein n=1 Tax=Cymbomonas tetramitiformis TaxID=36881 RepID=A0AAE0GLZ9_9CHLO|nr:hypothetical protein CYMTET_11720 [Cymbomonas tetramitiformis]